MQDVSRYMVQGERPLHIFHHHWLWIVQRLWYVALAVVVLFWLTFVDGSFQNLVEFVLLGCLLYGLGIWIHWYKRVFVITNERVLLVGAIFDFLANSDICPLPHVQDIDVLRNNVWRSLLGSVNYSIQTGKGSISLINFPDGIDALIWAARVGKTGGPKKYPTQNGTIIVE